jgi:hypothetical protein
MKVSDTWSRLVEFEDRAAELYRSLARRFADNSELSWFWMEMSIGERQHALLLEFCGCEHIVPEDLPDRQTVRKLDDFLEGLERRARRKTLSLSDAFLIAAELEGSEINEIYASVIMPVPGTLYIARKKAETLIGDHLQELLRGARKFGASADTIARIVEMKRRNSRTKAQQ